MKVYVPLGLDGYELCHPVDHGDFEKINVEVDGAPYRKPWNSIPVRLLRSDGGRTLLQSDSPWLGSHALIFRTKVLDFIGNELRKWGDLLPLGCPDADLWIYNPRVLPEALDEAESAVLRFQDGRIMMVQKYVFRTHVVEGKDVFKIQNLRVSPVFVSQNFVDMWNRSGLKGLGFTQIWAWSN